MKGINTVAFHTLGCKLNFSESSTIARDLSSHGFHKVAFGEKADVYVINTCSVTENADKECKQIVRSALKKSPNAKVIVIGCYAQLKPEKISNIEGVSMVLGAKEKFNIVEHLKELQENSGTKVFSNPIEEADIYKPSYSSSDRTRTFLKVQDGCDYTCAFCTIPLARGKSRSATIEETLATAREVIDGGTKEIVLTGVNIGDFGKGKKPQKKKDETFFELIKELDELKEGMRYRISSIEPNLLSNEIIEFVANSKCFMPHFHIPLQSGSNKVLKLMRRRYLRELYAERVQLIKSLMPHCAIGVDVIVGFPGETDEDFEETYKFLRDLDISYLHVFTYSERDNTDAPSFEGRVKPEVRKERNTRLRILSDKKQRAFYKEHIGSTRDILFESENKSGRMRGLTDNYIRVSAPYDPDYTNKVISTELGIIDRSGYVSVLLPSSTEVNTEK